MSEIPALYTRYFAKDGEGVQVVYGLRDDSPYRNLGYREVTEADFLASLPDPMTVPTALPVAEN